jgi:hypothetical protein
MARSSLDLSYFGAPWVDIDEWRDAPVRHRYVHGGFEGTDTRFSFYFPPKESFGGRFVQFLEGGSAGHEDTIAAGGPIAGDVLAHAFALRAYVVESNQGHRADHPELPKPAQDDVCSHLASIAAARHSKVVAKEIYGKAPRYGYVYGISGGGLRSITCLERGEGTWDGAVPCAIPHNGMFYGLAEHAAQELRGVIDRVVDASDVGGSGDPFDGLRIEEREALAHLYSAGYARGAEFMLQPGFYPVAFGLGPLFQFDPDYFRAFWAEPGYLGHDRPELFESLRIQTKAVVTRVMTATDLIPPGTPTETAGMMLAMLGGQDAPVAAIIEGLTPEENARLVGASLIVNSGQAAGRRLYCMTLFGPAVVGAPYITSGEVFEGVVEGDELIVDNADIIAFRNAYRHQIFNEEHRFGEIHPEWRYLSIDGTPIYPQRRPAWGFEGIKAARPYLHKFTGKMLLVQNAQDGTNWPSHAHNYATKLRKFAPERFANNFRLYWTDRAAHAPASFYPPGLAPVTTTRVIDYNGLLHQHLSDLIAWVEKGVEPPAATKYNWSQDGRLELGRTAKQRRGIQPVVTLQAGGAERAEVGVGEELTLTVLAELPPGTGTIVDVEWDLDGTGTWPDRSDGIAGTQSKVKLSRTVSFDKQGTYFPAVRVWSQRQGDASSGLFRVANLGRARVVAR